MVATPLEDASRLANRKPSSWREFRLAPSVRFELRLISPIIALWMFVFLLATPILTAGPRTGAGFGFFMITLCGIGIFMTVIWVSFYGTMSWTRIAVGITLVGATATLGMGIASLFHSGATHRVWIAVWIPVFVTSASLIATGAVRRFWGWRIFHVLQASEVADQKRFSIRDVLTWTLGLAAVFALLRFILGLFDNNFADSGLRIAFSVFAGVCVPSVAIISFLSLASRLRIYWLVLVVPMLAACIALLISALVSVGDGDIGFVMRSVFWPTLTWFSVAGYALTGAIAFHRQRGLVFVFGAGGDPASIKLSKSRYVSHLRSKISRLDRKSAMLQSDLETAQG